MDGLGVQMASVKMTKYIMAENLSGETLTFFFTSLNKMGYFMIRDLGASNRVKVTHYGSMRY